MDSKRHIPVQDIYTIQVYYYGSSAHPRFSVGLYRKLTGDRRLERLRIYLRGLVFGFVILHITGLFIYIYMASLLETPRAYPQQAPTGQAPACGLHCALPSCSPGE